MDVLVDFAIEHSEQKISGVMKMRWLDFMDQLWRCWNAVAHKKVNRHQQAIEEGWAARLLWFLEHPLAISTANHFLLLV